jgi:hypothetical protein
VPFHFFHYTLLSVYHSFFFLFVLPEEESETAAAAAAETAEVDARSIYVGNVSFLLLLCRFS